MKEENAAYKKQNQKLLDDLKALNEDDDDKRDLENRNKQSLTAYVGGDIEEKKAKIKQL